MTATAKDPWTVTLGWTPDQNFGRVSVMPNRTPVYAIVGLLRAGETHETVASEFDLAVEQVKVIDWLGDESREWA